MDFLRSVAEYYAQKYSDTNDWTKLCFVFPSHRAGAFFRKTLKDVVKKRVIYGNRMMITTIDALIEQKASELYENGHSPVRADKITLAFELYLAYRQVMGDNSELITDFERFYSWAPMFLGDFDDIDKYMVDAKDIYENVADYETLSDDLSHLTDHQRAVIEAFWGAEFIAISDEDNEKIYRKRFVETYKKMYELYTVFDERLEKKGLTRSGRIYRKVAEAFRNHEYKDDGICYAFIGFNALTESEIVIFNELNRKEGRAEFFWDYSPEMLKPITGNNSDIDLEYGPGRFIRKFKNSFVSPVETPQRTEDQELVITKFAYPQGQVSSVAKFVRDNWTAKDKISTRTAIVLTDENMLLPVMASLPTKKDDVPMDYSVNVTMGYPLKFSQVYGLSELLRRVQNDIQSSGDKSFSHSNVKTILQHPWINKLLGEKAQELLVYIIKENLVRIKPDFFNDKDALLQTIFCEKKPSEAAKYVIQIFDKVIEIADSQDDKLSAECAAKVKAVAVRFDELLNEYIGNELLDVSSTSLVMGMLDGILQTQTVDFLGEPLAGLQVMGILETRALDFDNLIILDMNEGVFPKKNTSMTFIPYVIRKQKGMPTHEFQDSIFSYYFFRLINRAKHVDLLYTDCSDATSDRKGISRFVQQIKFEYNFKYDEKTAVHQLVINNEEEPRIIKDENVIKNIHDRFSGNELTTDGLIRNYLSPSAISNYMRCPIMFYLQNVLRINEVEDVEEEADIRVLGTIFHNSMQELYERFIGEGGVMTEKVKKNFSSEVVKSVVLEQYRSAMKLNGHELQGRNIITYQVICKLVTDLIRKEEEFTFLGAEKPYRSVMTSNNCVINIGGTVDRQHLANGKHFIVDYKTGKSHKTNIKGDVDEWLDKVFDTQTKAYDDYKAVIQTLIYCKIMKDLDVKAGRDTTYYCGIIFMQDIFKKDFTYEVTYNDAPLAYDTAFHEKFSAKLQSVIDKIFGEENLLCTNKQKCVPNFQGGNTCIFYDICHRQK